MDINDTHNKHKDGYNRPKKTYTDNLSEEEILDKLSDYKKVESLTELKPKMHVRYFSLEVDKKKGTIMRKFRMGGFVANINLEDKYVMLSNGKVTWSVQFENAVLYKKMTIAEIKQEYEDDLEKAQTVNDKLMRKYNKISQAYENIKENYEKLKKINAQLKKKLNQAGYDM